MLVLYVERNEGAAGNIKERIENLTRPTLLRHIHITSFLFEVQTKMSATPSHTKHRCISLDVFIIHLIWPSYFYFI